MSETTEDNALKAISRTDDELRAGNYIILFGTPEARDLEGHGSERVNPDGTLGEYFTKSTDFESFYTRSGSALVDWEHLQGELGDEILGVVDWKTARVDDKGVFAERVMNRRSRYVQWIEELGWFDDGTLGTSSHAVQDRVEKASNGEITRWPIERDTITVQPMEPRMMREFGQNHLQAFKALGIPIPAPDDTEPEAEPEPEHETSPEDGTPSVDVAKARARLQVQILSLEER